MAPGWNIYFQMVLTFRLAKVGFGQRLGHRNNPRMDTNSLLLLPGGAHFYHHGCLSKHTLFSMLLPRISSTLLRTSELPCPLPRIPHIVTQSHVQIRRPQQSTQIQSSVYKPFRDQTSSLSYCYHSWWYSSVSVSASGDTRPGCVWADRKKVRVVEEWQWPVHRTGPTPTREETVSTLSYRTE